MILKFLFKKMIICMFLLISCSQVKKYLSAEVKGLFFGFLIAGYCIGVALSGPQPNLTELAPCSFLSQLLDQFLSSS